MPRRPDMPPLHRSALADDPIEQFREWYERAEGEVALANAMTLATVDESGAPDARMVLLKGYGPDGFRFFTNLTSAKARQLEASPRAALVLYWRELDRQVRIRGGIERLPDADSDGGPRALLGRRAASTALLGRLRPATRSRRVLAGTGRPPSRPLSLHAGGRQLAPGAAGALAIAGGGRRR